MRFTALLGLLSLLYVIVVSKLKVLSLNKLVAIQSPWFVSYNHKRPEIWDHINWTSFTSGFDDRLYFLRGTSVLIFAFIGHNGVFPVMTAMNDYHIHKRVTKVITTGALVQYFMYLILGVTGFLTVPINTPEIIIYRKNLVFDNDTLMIIGQVFVIVVLLMVTPVKYHSFRTAVLHLFYESDEISKTK